MNFASKVGGGVVGRGGWFTADDIPFTVLIEVS